MKYSYLSTGQPDSLPSTVLMDSGVESEVIRIWDSAKWMRDEIIVQGRLSFSLLRILESAKKGDLGWGEGGLLGCPAGT